LPHTPVSSDNLSTFGCQSRAKVNSVKCSEHYGRFLRITAPGDFNGLSEYIMSNRQQHQTPIFNIGAKLLVEPLSPSRLNIAARFLLTESIK